ncbi:MAG: UxaA family hydrolase [Treponema sp.]|nr:UxaA family hydrolase [Treponema sp.]
MRTLLLHSENDSVFTCLAGLKKGDSLDYDGAKITAAGEIPVYHKIARLFVKAGDEVFKYGEAIGTAICDIHPGDHVHVHNVESCRGRGDKR